jgi:hypothetical protein
VGEKLLFAYVNEDLTTQIGNPPVLGVCLVVTPTAEGFQVADPFRNLDRVTLVSHTQNRMAQTPLELLAS